mgnify:CR=1 FL=1
MMAKSSYESRLGERICRLDLNEGEIENDGIDKEKCKKLLRSLLDSE